MVGTPNHCLVEMNSFNLFALSGGGEQKCSFSACTCASFLLVLMACACTIGSICDCIPVSERGDQELSNDIKFIKIGPLLRKL